MWTIVLIYNVVLALFLCKILNPLFICACVWRRTFLNILFKAGFNLSIEQKQNVKMTIYISLLCISSNVIFWLYNMIVYCCEIKVALLIWIFIPPIVHVLFAKTFYFCYMDFLSQKVFFSFTFCFLSEKFDLSQTCVFM